MMHKSPMWDYINKLILTMIWLTFSRIYFQRHFHECSLIEILLKCLFFCPRGPIESALVKDNCLLPNQRQAIT